MNKIDYTLKGASNMTFGSKSNKKFLVIKRKTYRHIDRSFTRLLDAKLIFFFKISGPFQFSIIIHLMKKPSCNNFPMILFNFSLPTTSPILLLPTIPDRKAKEPPSSVRYRQKIQFEKYLFILISLYGANMRLKLSCFHIIGLYF